MNTGTTTPPVIKNKSGQTFDPETGKYKTGKPVEWTEEALTVIGEELIEWMKQENNIFFKKFLLEKGLDDSFISDRAKENPHFNGLIKRAKEIQEIKLAEGGLLGKYRDAMSIFLLKGYHQIYDQPANNFQQNQLPSVSFSINLPPGLTQQQINDVSFSIVPPDQISGPAPDQDNTELPEGMEE